MSKADSKMNWFKIYKHKNGYVELVNKRNSPLKYINFGILNLNKGEVWKSNTKDNETVLIVLSGRMQVNVQNKTFKIGMRKDVFSGKPEAVYIPREEKYTIKALSNCEVAVSSGMSDEKNDLVIMKQKDVKQRVAGKYNWKRQIYDIVNNEIKADRLIIGETYHMPGCWSCIPPHKHDTDRLPKESKLEELYFFKIIPEEGFGFERVYSEGEKFDKVFVLKNNALLCMPFGYHSLAVSPGYRLYYLWILAGEKRVVKQYFDPRYEWLNKW
ncbi:MAG: 5-deoxy-glucuronate isomerase [Candidatus Firestonebacteria bacterium]